MTAHDPVPQCSSDDSLVRPLASIGFAAILAAVTIFVLSGRLKGAGIAAFQPSGFAGVAAGSSLLCAFGIVACVGMMRARRRNDPALRWPQTALTVLFSAGTAYAVLTGWPSQAVTTTQSPSGGFTTASALLLLATPWLLVCRYLASITAKQLPEIDDLRSLTFLPLFFLLAEAILQVASTLGFGDFHWVRVGLATALLLVCIELSVRALGTWFLPPPDRANARAAIASVVAGVLRGRSLSPASVAGIVRSQFGMDFSRSWALRFVRTAAPPVILLMLAFCWFLTGVSRIAMNERGSYERFGNPVSMLQPGLHQMLPLPLGLARHVEFGVLHSVLAGDSDQGAGGEVADTSTAEGDAPASANRMWDSAQPSDVSYIIASSEQDRQSFQTVSASVRVLYRIGLTDEAARDALYRIADPDALVHSLSGRLLAQFFAARTLPVVLGEDQGVIAGDLRTRLQTALDGLESGIDIVAVTIEAIHPPSGAASAYRNVQAAEIAATTQISTEQGRAQTTKSVAQSNAHTAIDEASGAAAETISAAKVGLTDMTIDDRPYRAASQPFLLERYFTDLQTALANVPLEIVDHRLNGTSLPTIDLRPPGMVRDAAEQRAAVTEKTQ